MPTCLIVDDSHVVRKVLKFIAEDLGFTCTEAENGLIALEACEREMPDGIIIDWNMPIMDGLTFIQKLRKMPTGKTPRIILSSADTETPQIRKALSIGADEFIMKPFDANIIESKFRLTGLL